MSDTTKILNDLTSEVKRNEDFLHLTANECRMSNTAMKYMSSNLGQRYYFGGGVDMIVDFGNFTFVGMKAIEDLLVASEEAVCKMLNATGVNFNCLSGIHAMMCSILSTTEPGDCVMTVREDDGGHFATKGIIEKIGRKHAYATYDNDLQEFDLDTTEKTFKDNKARVLYLDISNHLKPAPISEIRKRFGDKAIIIYDASHTMGLMMGHVLENPLDVGADMISANTHKTLFGPQKGMIVFKNKTMADKCNGIINGYLKSSAHTENLIALGIAILEMEKFGAKYAEKVVDNANSIGQEFKKLGYKVREAGDNRITNTHQTHIFLDGEIDRLTAYKNLVHNNISLNFESVMGGNLFMRVGSQEITRRGMGPKDMANIAKLLDRALKGHNVKGKITSLVKRHNNIYYSFDKHGFLYRNWNWGG